MKTIRLDAAGFKEDCIVNDDYRRMLLVSFVGTLIIGTPLVYLLSPMVTRLGFGRDLYMYVIFMYVVIFTSLSYLQYRVLISKLHDREQSIVA